MADPRQEFLNVAMSHKGEDGTWAWSTSGLGRGNAWCAAFVIACGKTVGGILDKVIYSGTFMAGYLVEASVQKGYGSYQLGGHNGGNPSPAAGDLVTYNRGNPTSGSGVFAAQHIGIVYSVNGTTVTTIEGNTNGGKVDSHQISASSSEVAVFYRPNWASIGGSTSGNVGAVLLNSDGSTGTAYVGGDLYDTMTTRADSIMREVGYWSSNKPTSTSSKIRCSVINYTTQLGSFMKGAIGNGSIYSSSGTDLTSTADLSGMTDTNARAIMTTFLSMGYSAATACGIIGNMYQESGLKPNSRASEGGGLCGWSDFPSRGVYAFTNMVKYVGSNWADNLTGQVQYVDYTCHGNDDFRNIYSELMSCANTLAGAKQACEIFLEKYEQPGHYDVELPRRNGFTETFWNQIVLQV